MSLRSAIGFSCFHCGRPLPLSRSGVARCPQCGTDNFIELPRTQPTPTPPAWPDPREAPQPTAPAKPSGRVALWFALGVGVLGATVAASVAVSQGALGAGDASGIVSWVGSSSGLPCSVDANLDGAPDVVGIGVRGQPSVMALEARTGRVLWTRPAKGTPHPAQFCGGGGIVFYEASALSVRSVGAASGEDLWTAKLSDKLESVAFGDGCATVRTIDGSTWSADLTTGARVACAPVLPPQPRHGRPSRTARAGDVEFSLAPSGGAGTPRAAVRAARAGAKVWEVILPSLVASGDSSIAATPRGVVVAGTKHGDQAIALVLLDAKTGAVIASRERPSKHSTSAMSLRASGAAIHLESFGMVHAYDPSTLEPLWFAGSMWADG